MGDTGLWKSRFDTANVCSYNRAMDSTSPGVSKLLNAVKTRDLSLLADPKILSATIRASQLKNKKETLYLESLYDNALTPLNFASALKVSGDLPSSLEVGMHVVASGLIKKCWVAVLDPEAKICSLALQEASTSSARFVCVRDFSNNKVVPVLSNLVSSMRIVVAHVSTKISATQMARLMSRVRENNSILVLLDPLDLCEGSFDRRIVARTRCFKGIEKGNGVLIDREIDIVEYQHGIKSHQHLKRYA